MKLNLKRVGEITHMDAEGTPEEIAAFVALIEHQEQTISMCVRGKLSSDRAKAINGAVRSLVATPPQNGIGSAAFAG